jgi:hypothetical protein
MKVTFEGTTSEHTISTVVSNKVTIEHNGVLLQITPVWDAGVAVVDITSLSFQRGSVLKIEQRSPHNMHVTTVMDEEEL